MIIRGRKEVKERRRGNGKRWRKRIMVKGENGCIFPFFIENGEFDEKIFRQNVLEMKFCIILYSWYFSLNVIVFAYTRPKVEDKFDRHRSARLSPYHTR